MKTMSVAIDRREGFCDGLLRAGLAKMKLVAQRSNVMSDRELVERARKGDKDSYHQLVEKYQQKLFALAFRILQSQEEAEDVVQEGFVKAYLALKNFKGDSSFYTWIYRIVSNMAIDVKRKLKRSASDSLDSDDLFREKVMVTKADSQLGVDPHRNYEISESRSILESSINELSEEHRTIFLLREVEGLSYLEIAEALELSAGTVMSRLHYARKHLQNLISNGNGNGASSSSNGDAAKTIDREPTWKEKETVLS